jgi:hypothetical protein
MRLPPIHPPAARSGCATTGGIFLNFPGNLSQPADRGDRARTCDLRFWRPPLLVIDNGFVGLSRSASRSRSHSWETAAQQAMISVQGVTPSLSSLGRTAQPCATRPFWAMIGATRTGIVQRAFVDHDARAHHGRSGQGALGCPARHAHERAQLHADGNGHGPLYALRSPVAKRRSVTDGDRLDRFLIVRLGGA